MNERAYRVLNEYLDNEISTILKNCVEDESDLTDEEKEAGEEPVSEDNLLELIGQLLDVLRTDG